MLKGMKKNWRSVSRAECLDLSIKVDRTTVYYYYGLMCLQLPSFRVQRGRWVKTGSCCIRRWTPSERRDWYDLSSTRKTSKSKRSGRRSLGLKVGYQPLCQRWRPVYWRYSFSVGLQLASSPTKHHVLDEVDRVEKEGGFSLTSSVGGMVAMAGWWRKKQRRPVSVSSTPVWRPVLTSRSSGADRR